MIISENYRFDAPAREIKIAASKNPEQCKLSHWWEPGLNFHDLLINYINLIKEQKQLSLIFFRITVSRKFVNFPEGH